jgi:hypothetical protein
VCDASTGEVLGYVSQGDDSNNLFYISASALAVQFTVDSTVVISSEINIAAVRPDTPAHRTPVSNLARSEHQLRGYMAVHRRARRKLGC